MQIENVLLRGTGAAINVSLGFIPDHCWLWNMTDGTLATIGNPSRDIFAFTSGGTNVPRVGDKMQGATSGARAVIADIIVDTGTWAAGTAAGWIVFDQQTRVGTFTGGENLWNNTQQTAAGIDDLTMTAADAPLSEKIDTQSNVVTGNNAILAYLGDSTHAPGVIIGSAISTANKILHLIAIRSGFGAAGLRCPNSAVG